MKNDLIKISFIMTVGRLHFQICPPMPAHDWLHKIDWIDLEFVVEGRLVLRHNKKLQYGYTPKPAETLRFALLHMQNYCKEHKDGNPKITGLIKVVQHTRLNGVPLEMKLGRIFQNKV